jgi:hypothetical protein
MAKQGAAEEKEAQKKQAGTLVHTASLDARLGTRREEKFFVG